MKLYATLLIALLGFNAQAYAGSNPLKDTAVAQDLSCMYSLSQQYRITANAAGDAWSRVAKAKEDGNVVAVAMASAQFVYYRAALSEITEALVIAKSKLTADIKTASLPEGGYYQGV